MMKELETDADVENYIGRKGLNIKRVQSGSFLQDTRPVNGKGGNILLKGYT